MKESAPDDLIRAYLKGRLDAPARQQFEQLLQGDADLARTLALRRAEIAATEMLIAADTREWFQTWQQETALRPRSGKKKWVTWIAGSALLAFLLVLATRVLQSPQQPPAKQHPLPPIPEPPDRDPAFHIPPPIVATTPAKPARNPPAAKPYLALATRRLPNPVRATLRQAPSDTAALSPFRKAQDAFAAGNYPQTLALLAQTDSTQRQSVAFLAAHALFRLQRFSEAESRFANLIRENSRQYKFQSEWGLLMCRLAGLPLEKKAFHAQLETILKQKDHPYFNQAKALKNDFME